MKGDDNDWHGRIEDSLDDTHSDDQTFDLIDLMIKHLEDCHEDKY